MTITELRLFDRADGVRGHYCVGYTDEQGTSHYWGRLGGGLHGFCSAGSVFVGLEAAEAAFDAVAAVARAYGLVDVWSRAADRYEQVAKGSTLPQVRDASLNLMEARMEAARALQAVLTDPNAKVKLT